MAGSILQRPSDGDPGPSCVLVAGAAGGIGGAFCDLVAARFSTATIIRLARDPSKLAPLPARCVDIGFDIGDEASIRDAVEQIPGSSVVDWVLVATGWLHDRVRRPEKTYKSLDAIHLLHAYRINAIGPALLVKHLIPRLNPSRPCKLGVLSARVGSISDNRLGGWHAYRASKAALNMLIKNIAIELARNNGRHVIVGLQPGTTDTALSAPFQRHVPVAQLQSPDYTARQLAEVMLRLRTEDSGGLFDFLGESFAP